MSTELLDFSNVSSAEGGAGKYLKPGVYKVKPSAVFLVEKPGVTPRLDISFTAINEPYEGAAVTEKFYLSPKALGRLQYLHEKYLEYKLENKAISYSALAEYFSKKLLTKPKTIAIVVGAEEATNGKVYGRLPYADFILDDENIDEGAYDEGSEEYKRVVKKATGGGVSSSKTPQMSSAGASSGSFTKSDLPWDI